MGTWNARSTVRGEPGRVLELLTDPDAAELWSPFAFSVEDMDGSRLEPGCRTVLGGRLAGRWVEFELDVFEAADGRLSLRATGPVTMDVHYELLDGELLAEVTVRGGSGLAGRLLSSAADGLFRAGALQSAVDAIAREADADEELACAA